MARMSKIDKFKAKASIQMDHIKAGLLELRAKAKEAKLDARQEFDKGIENLEKMQADVKCKLEEWSKAGQDAAGDVKKSLNRQIKSLSKSVKKAYKSLV